MQFIIKCSTAFFFIEDGQNNCSNSLIYWAPDLTGLINNKLSHKESYNRR